MLKDTYAFGNYTATGDPYLYTSSSYSSMNNCVGNCLGDNRCFFTIRIDPTCYYYGSGSGLNAGFSETMIKYLNGVPLVVPNVPG